MTGEEFISLFESIMPTNQGAEIGKDSKASTSKTKNTTNKPEEGLVYGLKGIEDLFGISESTAKRYKNTILKPAIRQYGRTIIVDKKKALELFHSGG